MRWSQEAVSQGRRQAVGFRGRPREGAPQGEAGAVTGHMKPGQVRMGSQPLLPQPSSQGLARVDGEAGPWRP